jgi:putative transposase
MSHTYSQIFIHYVFAPKSRYPVFETDDRNLILKYMAGICKNYECFLEEGHIMPDHAHLLIKIPAKHSVSGIAKIIKANVSRFINTQTNYNCRFEWQEGYGAFSCSFSMLEIVKSYIRNQEEHHKSHKFEDEFRALLIKHGLSVSS